MSKTPYPLLFLLLDLVEGGSDSGQSKARDARMLISHSHSPSLAISATLARSFLGQVNGTRRRRILQRRHPPSERGGPFTCDIYKFFAILILDPFFYFRAKLWKSIAHPDKESGTEQKDRIMQNFVKSRSLAG